MKMVRFIRKLAHIAWIEFETQSRDQLSGLSLKLGPSFFFFYVCVYLKITGSWDRVLYSTSNPFLLHIFSVNHFFKIVIFTVARASN
jgi:hypothetical protein